MHTLTKEQWRLIRYLNFKMQCAADQEDVGIRLDYKKVLVHIGQLEKLQDEKVEELKLVMPKVPKYTKKVKPKVTHKKDGTLSSHGEKWFTLLRQNKLPMNYNGELQIHTSDEEPNPNSTQQVKDWLVSLGWEPETFKYVRNKETGEERKIEQVRKDGELCPSVLRLVKTTPELEALEGLSIIQHRLGVFTGFRDAARQDEKGDWYIRSEIGGLTNTLRFKHRKPIANLPKVGVPWGEEIRSCLIATDGEVLCGSDMVSLESTTKRHYMQPIDPDYVEEMSQPGFDEHLNLAVFAGALPQEDVDAYNIALESSDLYKRVKKIRGIYKPVNYSGIYGIGPPKLARELGIPLREAKALLEAYWERNKAVKVVVEQQYVKTLKNGELWLLNPVSKFYYSLRYMKDLFSTLNQGTGVYCFDRWVAECKKLGVTIAFQYHDEQLDRLKEGEQKEVENKLQQAIEKLNGQLKLNVPLAVDVQFGYDYGSVH
jgi:DNA-binding transcriptional MerR regulator